MLAEAGERRGCPGPLQWEPERRPDDARDLVRGRRTRYTVNTTACRDPMGRRVRLCLARCHLACRQLYKDCGLPTTPHPSPEVRAGRPAMPARPITRPGRSNSTWHPKRAVPFSEVNTHVPQLLIICSQAQANRDVQAERLPPRRRRRLSKSVLSPGTGSTWETNRAGGQLESRSLEEPAFRAIWPMAPSPTHGKLRKGTTTTRRVLP